MVGEPMRKDAGDSESSGGCHVLDLGFKVN